VTLSENLLLLSEGKPLSDFLCGLAASSCKDKNLLITKENPNLNSDKAKVILGIIPFINGDWKTMY
jgi:hypothetical protein